METYQILGLIGSILLILAIIIAASVMAFIVTFGMMRAVHPLIFPFFVLIGIPAIVLGLIGSLISDKTAAGILLILASFLSLPIIFGFFGISFILLLVGGILALTKK